MLEKYRRAVDRMIGAREPFGAVEDAINEWPLDEEGRSMLWLYAAAHTEPPLFFTALAPPIGGLLVETVG